MPMKLVLFALTCLLLIAAISPAPLPYYLAINYATKQCAVYWGGDEYVTYDLPPNWSIFQPQVSNGYLSVETAAGACRVAKAGLSSVIDGFAQACCAQLGYTYVPDNIGIYRLTPDNIANRKTMGIYTPEGNYTPQPNTQASAETTQTIAIFAIAFLYVVSAMIMILAWRHGRQGRK